MKQVGLHLYWVFELHQTSPLSLLWSIGFQSGMCTIDIWLLAIGLRLSRYYLSGISRSSEINQVSIEHMPDWLPIGYEWLNRYQSAIRQQSIIHQSGNARLMYDWLSLCRLIPDRWLLVISVFNHSSISYQPDINWECARLVADCK